MSDPEFPASAAAEPRWLSPEERATWLSLVGVMVKLPAALDAQLQRDSGLSYIEYMVLAMLSEQPDRMMRMSELAAAINASLSRLSHIAKRLEGQGFHHSPARRRRRSLHQRGTDRRRDGSGGGQRTRPCDGGQIIGLRRADTGTDAGVAGSR